MASTSSSTLPQGTSTPQSAPQSAQPTAGAPRGRGGSRGGPYRGRGGSRGRGNRGNRQGPPPQHQPYQARQPPPGLPTPHTAPPRPPPDDLGGGVSSQDPTRDAAESPAGSGQEGTTEESEGEVCFICASPVQHHSVAPCNHRTCHICALRLRTLYKTRACAHCRTEAQYLIFTDDPVKRFEDFEETEIKHNDETLGIKYTDNNIHADTIILLRYNCPDHGCDQACLGWPHLHQHVKSVHHKVMCDLCTRNKKVFTHEHELFTPPELKKHERSGDDHPGAVDQSGFKGHPECGFCRTRFYGDDELYAHCRDKHERCHICDRRRQGGNQQYFVNYDSLEQHFRKDHFLCADKDCLDKKFVVFESEIDMKAHQLESHPNGLTKDARRDARRVDISTFDFRTPHESSRRGRGGRETRGRDPNVDPLPQSTAQPLRRDELAYQRQMAINNAQSSTARTFGSQLTPANPPPAAARGRPTTPNAVSSSLDSLSLNDTSSADLTPQQQARQIAHTSLISRASGLLGNDPTKLATFRSSVSSYKSNSLSASDLITTFFSLFDAPASELGKLINELAELYEDEKKRLDLRKSWNDWRAINEDYPSLPNLAPTSSAITGGSRVLRLKSSTQNSANMGRPGSQAPRGPQQAQSAPRGWASSAASGSRGPAISSTGSIARVGTTTPWAGTSTAAPSRPPAAARQKGPAVDAFPALPMARKPNTLVSAGMTRGSIRPAWEAGASSTSNISAWGATNGATASSGDPIPDLNGIEGVGTEQVVGGGVGGKKKGKQGKKEVLYKFG